MEYPEDLSYTKEHLWIRVAGNRGVIGITDHAQQEMGEIIYADLPDEGAHMQKEEVFGTLESSKTVAELFAIISGEVVSINKDLEEEPSLVNDDPYGSGWLISMEVEDPEELEDLLSSAEYESFLEKKGT